MQAQVFGKLREAVSAPRLDPYRAAGDSDFQVICNYLWNSRLCESLYPALQTLETTLRNSIHTAASQRYKTAFWFDAPGWPLHEQERAGIIYARSELSKKNKPHDAQLIITELTFGFWASLLDSRYDRVWPKIIFPAFPSMPRAIRNRPTLSKRLNDIRRLRNKVFHHERISDYPDLKQRHADIIEAVGWICREWQSLLSAIDRFPQVCAEGDKAIRRELGRVLLETDDYAI